MSYSLCRPDDALIVRDMYQKFFLFVFYCETYIKHIPRKVYLQCFTYHHHPRQTNIVLIAINTLHLTMPG